MADATAAESSAGNVPLAGLLRRLAETLPVASIDALWVFPPRSVQNGESRVVVASAFSDDDPDRRRVFTAHYRVRTDDEDRAEIRHAIAENALAPAERIDRVVDGVLRRLDDDLAHALPDTFAIEGEPEHWDELLASLAGDAGDSGEKAAADARRDAIPAGDATSDDAAGA